MCIAFTFYSHFWQFRRRGTIVIDNFGEEATFYLREEATILLGKLGRRLVEFFLFMPKTMLEVGWSFILWSKPYLEFWSYTSSYFIGVALLSGQLYRHVSFAVLSNFSCSFLKFQLHVRLTHLPAIKCVTALFESN